MALLRRAGTQGISGDSIPFVPRSFWDASVAAGYPITLKLRISESLKMRGANSSSRRRRSPAAAWKAAARRPTACSASPRRA